MNPASHGKSIHPQHCFCHFPEHELKKWVLKCYRDHCSTVELLDSTSDPHDREIISIIALLDVDDTTLLKMMGDVNLPEHHILHCRENVRKILGLESEGKILNTEKK